MSNDQDTQNPRGDNHQGKVNTGEIDGAGKLNPDADWSRGDTIAPRAIGTILLVAAVFLLILFGLSMCGAPSINPQSSGAPKGAYSILEQKVDGAFGQARESAAPQERGAEQPSESEGSTLPAQIREQSQQEPQIKAPEPLTPEEQQRRHEEMMQRQRDAVPSILPESPPAPVPLGTGY